MDLAQIFQENPGLVGIVGAVVGFVASQLVQVWRDHMVEQRMIAREIRADRRAQRDAKLARMRKAFEPVLVAAGGLQTAAGQYFFSQSGQPDADSKTILETSLKGINEARAQIWLEEGFDDVGDELQRAFQAFETIRFEVTGRIVGRGAAVSADELNEAFATVRVSSGRLRALVSEHIREVERSV